MQQQMIQEQRNQIADLTKALMENHSQVKQQEERLDKISSAGKGSGGFKQISGIKPPKPDFYKGKRDALEINAWIDQIERYGKYFGVSDGMDFVEFAVFYLGGLARDWWTNQSGHLKERITNCMNLFQN